MAVSRRMACTSAPLCNQCAKTCSALQHTKPKSATQRSSAAHAPPSPLMAVAMPRLARTRTRAGQRPPSCCPGARRGHRAGLHIVHVGASPACGLAANAQQAATRVLAHAMWWHDCACAVRARYQACARVHANHSAGPHVHMPCQQRTSISPDAGRHGISGVHHPRPHPAASAAACVAARVGALCKLLGRLCRAAHVPHVFRIQARCRGAPIGCASAPCRSISNNARI